MIGHIEAIIILFTLGFFHFYQQVPNTIENKFIYVMMLFPLILLLIALFHPLFPLILFLVCMVVYDYAQFTIKGVNAYLEACGYTEVADVIGDITAGDYADLIKRDYIGGHDHA